MMQKFLIQLLISLLERLGERVVLEVKDLIRINKIKEDQDAKREAMDNAKTPDDIRNAHRNTKL